METLKKLCPIEIAKNLGREAIWMFNTALTVKDMVGEMTFQDWDDSQEDRIKELEAEL